MNYKIGDRVRMARPVNACNLGLTGTIRAFFPAHDALGGLVNCHVDWDQPHYGLYSHTDQLEPLTPPPQMIAWEHACFDRDGSYRGVTA